MNAEMSQRMLSREFTRECTDVERLRGTPIQDASRYVSPSGVGPPRLVFYGLSNGSETEEVTWSRSRWSARNEFEDALACQIPVLTN